MKIRAVTVNGFELFLFGESAFRLITSNRFSFFIYGDFAGFQNFRHFGRRFDEVKFPGAIFKNHHDTSRDVGECQGKESRNQFVFAFAYIRNHDGVGAVDAFIFCGASRES